MNVLHCMPLGESMLPEFIRRLQEAGRNGCAGRMAMVLPSPYLLEQARTQLRLTEIAAWEFPRILSLDELAAHLSGLRKISRVEQETLIGGIVGEAAATGQFPYFGKILDFPGFIAALARLFDELKMAAVTPAELATAVDALTGEVERNRERDAAIVDLFHAYQARLTEASLMDLGGMYWLAIDKLARPELELPFGQVFMTEFSMLSPLRLQLIERLKRRVPVEIGICYEKNRPGVFRSVEPVYQALVGMGFTPEFNGPADIPVPALARLRRELFAERPVPLEDGTGIEIVSCPDHSRELDVAADRIKALLLERDADPQTVAVVTNNPEAYSRLQAVLADRGVPVDRAEAVPVMERALPRLVLAWLNLVQERGSRAAVFAVVKSPYMADRLDWDGDRLERLLLDEVIRGWDEWPPALDRRAPTEETGARWRQNWQALRQRSAMWAEGATWEEWAERLRDLLLWVDVPSVLNRCRQAGTLALPEVRAELQSFQAVLAAAEELAALSGIAQLPGEAVGPGAVADLLRRLLAEATVCLTDRQATGVQVVTPETASGMNFSTVFVLGLAEGEFPAPPRESWLYDDRERGTLAEAGVLLATAEGRTAAADFAFALAAGMATERLYLSCIDNGETLPSRYLPEVSRLFLPGAITKATFHPDQVVAEQASAVWSWRELQNAGLYHVWNRSDPFAEWSGLYPALQPLLPSGLVAKAAIESSRPGAYAGCIDSSLIGCGRLSPSALESYAACPFAYFVSEVLGIGDWSEATAGFDAVAAGSVWHEVLAAFLSRRRGQRLQPSAQAEYEQELAQLLAGSAARRERQGRVMPSVWWRFEQPRWEQALRDWLAGELERQADEPQWLPQFFEWAFGMELRYGCDPASTERPLTLTEAETGETVELQGKIDRIDTAGGQYRVIDYKTGKPPARKLVEQGVRLQVPVYMMAVAELLVQSEQADVAGVYLPVGVSAAGLGLPGGKMSREELLEVAKQAVFRYAAGIRRGEFPAQPAGNCPDWCAARTFCRRQAAADGEGTEEAADE